MYEGVITFAVALAASFGLTVPVRRLALKWGMVDRPGPRKVHRAPMPLLGGLAIYCGAVLAILFSLGDQPRAQVFAILTAATLLLVVGTLDDRGLLHHQVKLLIAMPLSAITLCVSGVQAHVFSAFLPSGVGHWLDVGLTVFWVVGITAAFSILDHMDGLCSGAAAIAALFFAILAIRNGQVLVATLGAAVLGAALGFLRWNFNPAKIFMGDGGAMFLGFMMATLGLKLRLEHQPLATGWMIPILVLIIPIFDTTLVSISRSRRGLIPFASPGKDHIAHRLTNVGLSQRRAVLVLYGVGFLSGLLALVVSRLPVELCYALSGLLAVVAAATVIMLERLPFDRQKSPPKAS